MKKSIKINWISRTQIINELLDQINSGVPLSEEQEQLLKDMSK